MNQPVINKRILFRMFMSLFIVTLFITFFVLIWYEINLVNDKRLTLINEEHIAVDTLSQVIGKDLKNVVTDLEFMKYELLGHDHKEDLKSLWENFIVSKKFYDQIRFIDSEGQEVIRVNYNKGNVDFVDKDMLQNKADRYYFEESILLEDGEIYVSKLDLNIENSMVEIPEKPMIRIALRVKTEDVDGILLVNFLAQNMLNDIALFSLNSQGNYYLINERGDFLYHHLPSKTFRFMYETEDKGNIFIDYPMIESTDQEEMVFSDAQLFIVKPLNLEVIMDFEGYKMTTNENLYLVAHADGYEEEFTYLNMKFSNILKQVYTKNRFAFVIILTGTFLVAYLQYRIKKSKRLVRELYEKDDLTNIYNRRAGMIYFDEMIEEVKISDHELAVVFIDVDGLKQVNDVLGHEKGDDLLVSVTNIIRDEIRDNDLFMRLGGDEFLLVLANINMSVAEQIMKRVYNRIDNINIMDDKPYYMSFSYGITSTLDAASKDPEILLRVSDEKMYLAKHKKTKKSMLKENHEKI